MKLSLCVLIIFFVSRLLAYGEENLEFGTKTPYDFSFLPPDYNTPDCKIIYVNALYRHGTRYPCKSDFNRFLKFENLIKIANVRNQTSEKWIRNWKNLFAKHAHGSLAARGANEHFELGCRFKNSFFRHVNLNKTLFEFEVTSKLRTYDSFKFFVKGLLNESSIIFEKPLPVCLIERPKTQDPLLRFFDCCAAYKKQTQHSKVDAYDLHKSVLARGLSDTAQKLKKLFNFDITSELLDTMYKLCIFEYAVYGITSQWCSLMTHQELRFLEYADDLRHYEERKYANDLSYKISAHLLQDFVDKIEDKIRGDEKLGTIRFAHAETLLPLIMLLGIYNNSETLDSDLVSEQYECRKFQTSNLSPFAGSLSMALFDCAGWPERYQVGLFHNERPVDIPKCDVRHGYKCSLSEFKKQYAQELAIEIEKIC